MVVVRVGQLPREFGSEGLPTKQQDIPRVCFSPEGLLVDFITLLPKSFLARERGIFGVCVVGLDSKEGQSGCTNDGLHVLYYFGAPLVSLFLRVRLKSEVSPATVDQNGEL